MKKIILLVIFLFFTVISISGTETTDDVELVISLFLTIVFIVLIVIILSSFPSRLNSPSHRGRVGERKVVKEIHTLDPSKYISFHNIILRTPDGSTQIDHIVISQFGIFVIETKSLKGWIFGGIAQREWTQTIYRKKYRFQNPLRQNYKHTKAVQNFFGVSKNCIISVVVFAGDSEFMTKMPNNILELRQLTSFIQSYSNEVLSRDKVEQYIEKFNILKETSFIGNEEHINNISKNIINPICPRCGKQMVIRIAGKKAMTGSKFWGCSGFPACKVTKKYLKQTLIFD